MEVNTTTKAILGVILQLWPVSAKASKIEYQGFKEVEVLTILKFMDNFTVDGDH